MRADPDTHAFRHLLKKHLQNGCPNRMGEQTSNIKTAYYLECNMPSLKVLPSTTTYSKHRQMPTLSPMHLCTYALKHLSTSKLPADKKNDCQSPCVTKTAITALASQPGSYSACCKTAIAHHVSQKTTVAPRVTKDDGTHHVSQKTTVHHVSQKTTVHTTCHKRQRYTPRVTKDDGTHHVSQKTTVHHVSQKTTVHHVSQKTTVHTCHKRLRYTTRVTKTTVHNTCLKDDGTCHV